MAEHNAWIHCFAAVCAVVFGFIFDISPMEWVAVTLAMGAVLSAEAFNTAVETLANYVCEERKEAIKNTKDLSAAGVLLTVVAAAIVGLVVFIPKIVDFLDRI
jgi:Diacylglycerol kinase